MIRKIQHNNTEPIQTKLGQRMQLANTWNKFINPNNTMASWNQSGVYY